jgi:carotenoid cleavage dioxygenase-like enzyme
LTINPKSGEIIEIEKLSFDSLEFPVVHDEDVGLK